MTSRRLGCGTKASASCKAPTSAARNCNPALDVNSNNAKERAGRHYDDKSESSVRHGASCASRSLAECRPWRLPQQLGFSVLPNKSDVCRSRYHFDETNAPGVFELTRLADFLSLQFHHQTPGADLGQPCPLFQTHGASRPSSLTNQESTKDRCLRPCREAQSSRLQWLLIR